MIRFDLNNYLNKEFGCYKVIDYSHYDKDKKLNFIKVICNKCGNIKYISSNRLKTSKHLYCNNCKDKSRIVKNSRLHRIWSNMKTRCYNPTSNRYYCYGGRGIKVCDEWLNNYKSFQSWALNNGYNDNLTLDRINNNKNYEPNNCRWATYKQQLNNSSRNRIVEINGNKKTITEWCDYYNIPYYIINNRINKYGWEIERAFTTPIKKEKLFNFNGKQLTINQISILTGIPKYTLYRHLKNQKDFVQEQWHAIEKFYKGEINND